MKHLFKYLLPLCCGIMLISCYGIEKEDYRELASITVSGLDHTIYTKATEKLHLDQLKVESGNGREPAFEWSYGKPSGDFPGMLDTTFLSNSPTLDYTFKKAGSYVLRLRIDNGERIAFHYYDLRVQSVYDEGFLILCNNAEEKGSLAFVKKRSPQEEAAGAQEVWDNILPTEGDTQFEKLRDLYLFSSPGYSSGILISSGDEAGSVYRLDPVSIEVTYHMKGMDEYGTKMGSILGEKTSGTSQYSYLIGDDGKAYRYEYSADMLVYRETTYPSSYGYQSYYANSNAGTRELILFGKTGINRFPMSKIVCTPAPEGFEIVNVAGARTNSEIYYFIARAKEGTPRKVKIMSLRGTSTSATPVLEYDEESPMLMAPESKMIVTKLNQNVYYNYDNKIYHWAVASVKPMVPAQGAKADITLPEGEQIVDMCTNAIPSTSATTIDDDRLVIATYNANAPAGRKPGSLYIYNLKTMELVKKYEGICEKPVALVYKFPTSN